MALALTIVIALTVILLSLVGYLRDLRRSLLALLGTLVGAILVNFWGDQWGASLAGRLVNADQQRLTFYVNCAMFLWSALIVGYGGGILLNRPKDRPFQQRVIGALLGFVNGTLIVGFMLRFASSEQPSYAPAIQANPLAKIIHDGLPVMFLAVAGLVTVMVGIRAVLGLFVRSTPPPPPPKPTAPRPTAGAAPGAAGPAEKRLNDQDVLKKVADGAKR